MRQARRTVAVLAAAGLYLSGCSDVSHSASSTAVDAELETAVVDALADTAPVELPDTASAAATPADATADVAADVAADSFGVYPKQVSEALPTVAPRFAIPATAQAAEWPGAPQGQKVYVLPSGRWLTPMGEELFLGNFPQGLTLHPNGKVAYVANGGHAHAIQVIDLGGKKVVQTVKKPFVYRWLEISSDGKYLYASGGPRRSAWRMAIAADGTLSDDKEYTTEAGFFGIAASPDGKYLYGLVDLAKGSDDKLHPQLWRLDTATGDHDATAQLGDAPYDLVVAPDGKTAFSVGWRGGRVQRIDLGSMAAPGDDQTVKLGWNGQGIALSPDGKTVYATAVEGDLVVVLDAASMAKIAEIPINYAKIAGMAPQGRDPGFVRVSPDGKRVYVVCAMSNEVIVIDADKKSVVGTIATGWYPSGLAISPDSKTLYVVNAKGNGFPPGPWTANGSSDGYMGTLLTIAIPDDATLKANQTLVLDNMYGVQGVGRVPASPESKQVIPDQGGSQQIRHVVYLIRENKTFDVELGDLAGQVTGVVADPQYALFGEEYTPNLHKLAKQYCLLDNFYTDGDYSAVGHSFAMAGKASDYIEKFYPLQDTGAAELTWGVGPASRPGRGFFFHNVLAHGLTVASYGEVVGMVDAFSLTKIMQLQWPGLAFNLTVLDIAKATWFQEHIKSIDLPNFMVMVLPVNHTCCGGDPAHLSPKSMVADNDEATGLVIEALTQHKDWGSTVVFVFEDDPQDGGDSVEYHRSPLLVISPWAKRGHLEHTHHATGAIHATMERILDVSPLTELDAMAAPVYGCFTNQADASGYQHIARLYPPTLNKDEPKKKWNKSLQRQWRDYGPHDIDGKPGLGRLLWQQYQGSPAPWPVQRYAPEGREDTDD